jgi:hypothetical protein
VTVCEKPSLTIVFGDPYYFVVQILSGDSAKEDDASSGSNDHYRTDHWESHNSLLAGDDFLRRSHRFPSVTDCPWTISQANKVRKG